MTAYWYAALPAGSVTVAVWPAGDAGASPVPAVWPQRYASGFAFGSTVAPADIRTSPAGALSGPLPLVGAGKFDSTGRTWTLTRSAVDAAPSTVSSNTRSALARGAVNDGNAVVAPASVTAGPLTCVHCRPPSSTAESRIAASALRWTVPMRWTNCWRPASATSAAPVPTRTTTTSS